MLSRARLSVTSGSWSTLWRHPQERRDDRFGGALLAVEQHLFTNCDHQ